MPKGKVPSPFRDELLTPFGVDNYNNSEKGLPAPVDKVDFIIKDKCISHDLLGDFAARIQNWVFDRFIVEAKVPVDIKLDIIADFPLALESIIANLSEPNNANACKPIADEASKSSLMDVDLDFSLSATCPTTPISELPDTQENPFAAFPMEPILRINKTEDETDMDYCIFHDNLGVDGEKSVDRYIFHGLPNLPLSEAYPTLEQTYEDAKWALKQVSSASS